MCININIYIHTYFFMYIYTDTDFFCVCVYVCVFACAPTMGLWHAQSDCAHCPLDFAHDIFKS